MSFAKSLSPYIKKFLPVWRKVFGVGLQADSSTSETGKVRLFGLGADDYIVEPFDPDEFLARVKPAQKDRARNLPVRPSK